MQEKDGKGVDGISSTIKCKRNAHEAIDNFWCWRCPVRLSRSVVPAKQVAITLSISQFVVIFGMEDQHAMVFPYGARLTRRVCKFAKARTQQIAIVICLLARSVCSPRVSLDEFWHNVSG